MERNEQRVQQILEWRESLLTLSDNHFFELFRMYLGEIKTPYNKQKLVEELSAFLHKEANVKNILLLLSQTDLLVLSAINTLQTPTQEKLSRFFAADFSFADLYERLLNLEERLLVYRKSENRSTRFLINPLLLPHIEPSLGASQLLPVCPPPRGAEGSGTAESSAEAAQSAGGGGIGAGFAELPPQNGQPPFSISPLFLASVFSFFRHESDFCKADGSLKRRAESLIEAAFPFAKNPRGREFFLLVFEGLKNLQLFVQDGSEIACAEQRWAEFAKLDELSQQCYICAASCGKFTRENLRRQAQLVMDIVLSVPQAGFTKTVLQRNALLQSESASPDFAPRKSRLASLLQENPADRGAESGAGIPLVIEHIIKCALLQPRGNAYVPAPVAARTQAEALQGEAEAEACGSAEAGAENAEVGANAEAGAAQKALLTLGADFSAALLPGAKLGELLPLMQFLQIATYDTVPRFELNKRSCCKAFDAGFSAAQVRQTAAAFSAHALPQSVAFSIDEWFAAYNSASLYKGYVLKAASEKQVFIENNETLAAHMRCKLADGIYLLDFFDDEEARKVMRECGLDFVGAIKAAQGASGARPLVELVKGARPLAQAQAPSALAPKSERDAFIRSLLDELASRNFSEEQTDALASRIRRKIVVNPQQLRAESVRFERVEAGGMDFLGKVHVVDHAISSGSLIELLYDGSAEKIVGLPLSLEKRNGDALIRLQKEPSHEVKLYSVSKANLVKRIRGAIFKESF